MHGAGLRGRPAWLCATSLAGPSIGKHMSKGMNERSIATDLPSFFDSSRQHRVDPCRQSRAAKLTDPASTGALPLKPVGVPVFTVAVRLLD
jgi:hypothetical protein